MKKMIKGLILTIALAAGGTTVGAVATPQEAKAESNLSIQFSFGNHHKKLNRKRHRHHDIYFSPRYNKHQIVRKLRHKGYRNIRHVYRPNRRVTVLTATRYGKHRARHFRIVVSNRTGQIVDRFRIRGKRRGY